MPGTARLGWGDVLALVTLFATSIVIALPVLRGGQLTYIDNPVHLAEIYELARVDGGGWSDIAFAGFPLHTLHSPLWYGALAWLVRNGASAEPLYCLGMLLGFSAPAMALYLVARRRTSPLRAGLLAYALLIQPTMIWGIGSPLGGMWPHGLSHAGLILLADLYSRPRLALHEHVVASIILALSGLTHLFVLPLVALLAGITTWLHGDKSPEWEQDLRLRVAGWAIAALASAKYWLTIVLVGNDAATPHQFFHVPDLLVRLLLPSDAMYLLEQRTREGIHTGLYLTDAVPMLLVSGLGLVGIVRARRSKDPLGRVGAGLAVVLFVLLVVDTRFSLRFLGPVTFRQIEGLRIGLCLAAVPVLAAWPARPPRAPYTTGLMASAAALALGGWWGLPLARQNPEYVQEEYVQTHELWKWLGHNAEPDWGRVYIQDTFGQRWEKGGTAYSHHLVLTSYHTGLSTLGPYYGVVPFGLRWTLSEFNSLFTTRSPTKEWLLEAMEKTNAGVLVTSNPVLADYVGKMKIFDRLHGAGRYEVFRRKDAENRPIAELSPSNVVTDVSSNRGDFQFTLEAGYPKARVLVKTSYHPWWRIEGPVGAWLRESPEGFLVVDDIPKGTHRIRLRYTQGELPGRLSIAGWMLLSGWAIFASLRLRKSRAEAAT